MNDIQPVAVGLIGCGNISGAYMRMLKTLPAVQVVACADLRPEAAQALADQYALPSARSVDALLADPSIEVVLNLTIPQAHGAVALAALEAGKSVYNEKPLALTRAEGQRMLLLAAQQGLRVGGAPDTFLGGGLQTCRQLIDEGAIGTPVAATAFMMSRGHEHWHPNPAFYYQQGGGPMFDMGPLLFDRPGQPLGPGAAGERHHPNHPPTAHDHQPATLWRGDKGRSADPCGWAARLLRWPDRDDHHHF